MNEEIYYGKLTEQDLIDIYNIVAEIAYDYDIDIETVLDIVDDFLYRDDDE